MSTPNVEQPSLTIGTNAPNSAANCINDPLSEFDGKQFDGLVFCRKVYSLFELIRSEPDGIERIRLRSNLVEKRLMDELLPICRYVQTYYRLGRYISVCWVNGNQSYDAKLFQQGQLVEQGRFPAVVYLEATCAMHENEHWIRKLLTDGMPVFAPEGIEKHRRKPVKSRAVVFTDKEHVRSFAPIVVSLIRKKTGIAYPENTSLVVQCHLNSLYTPDDWNQLVSIVEEGIGTTQFKEVLLFDGTTERATSLTLDTECMAP